MEVRNLRVEFHLTEGLLTAVDGIDLVIRKNRILGMMGESGCGKSVTSRAIMGIIPTPPATVNNHRQSRWLSRAAPERGHLLSVLYGSRRTPSCSQRYKRESAHALAHETQLFR